MKKIKNRCYNLIDGLPVTELLDFFTDCDGGGGSYVEPAEDILERERLEKKIDKIGERNFIRYKDSVSVKSEFIAINFIVSKLGKKYSKSSLLLKYKDYKILKKYFEENLRRFNDNLDLTINNSTDCKNKYTIQNGIKNNHNIIVSSEYYYSSALQYFNLLDNVSYEFKEVEFLNYNKEKIKEYDLSKEQLKSRFRFILAISERCSPKYRGRYSAEDNKLPELIKSHNLISKLISNKITKEQYNNPESLIEKYEPSYFQQLWDVLFLYDMRFNHNCKLIYSTNYHSRSIKENEIMITLDEKYREFRINKLVNIKYLPIIKHIAHRNKSEYITQSDFDNCKENINRGGEARISIGDGSTHYKLNEDTREFLESILCDSDIKYAISDLMCRLGVNSNILEPSDLRIEVNKIAGYDGFCYFLLNHPDKRNYIKKDPDFRQYFPKLAFGYAIDIILERFATLITSNHLLDESAKIENKIIAIENIFDILDNNFYAIEHENDIRFVTKKAYLGILKYLVQNPIRYGEEEKYKKLLFKNENISFKLTFDRTRSDDEITSTLDSVYHERKMKDEYLNDNYHIFKKCNYDYENIVRQYKLIEWNKKNK